MRARQRTTGGLDVERTCRELAGVAAVVRPFYGCGMVFAPLVSSVDVEIEEQDRAWVGRFAAVDVVRFRHRRFNGTMSESRQWELLRRGLAAAVLPYDPWTDRVVLIEQFRLPALAAGLDGAMVEIPAGLCEAGESPEATVRREAMEEMGIETDLLTRIADVVLTPGGADERCVIFAGRVRAPAAGADGVLGLRGVAAEQEDIRVRVAPAQVAIDRAVAGAYTNSVTTIALLWLAARRAVLRSEWT